MSLPRSSTALMAEVANYGTASFAYTTGKNSTDGAMIIDAMDLLFTNRFTSFCIVSSDSDFTRLAARIREQGVTVYGFGERKTNNAFIAACSKFVYFDVLNVSFSAPEKLQSPPPASVPRVSTTVTRQTIHVPSARRPLDHAALSGLANAITNSIGYDGDWANLAEVGLQLNRISPDLNARNYGYERLKDFVEGLGIAIVRMKDMGNHPAVALARLKQNAADSDS